MWTMAEWKYDWPMVWFWMLTAEEPNCGYLPSRLLSLVVDEL
jgi:hypothetical protein